MKKKKVYINMSGGLGNQLFQYAYGRYLEETFEYTAIYITKSYKKDTLRNVSIQNFNIVESEFVDSFEYWSLHHTKKKVFKLINKLNNLRDKILGWSYIQPSITYKAKSHFLNRIGIYNHESSKYLYPVKMWSKDGFATGAWHTAIYADRIKDRLVREIELIQNNEFPSNRMKQIQESESVCVHIRRGDYTEYSYYIVCSMDYYRNAMKELRALRPKAKFFVFSDDIAWVKDNLDEEATYIEEINQDYIDFTLMKSCNHFIISNSTFSWWAAYLGQFNEKIVMTPNLWYTKGYGENKPQLNLKGWIVLNTECNSNETDNK